MKHSARWLGLALVSMPVLGAWLDAAQQEPAAPRPAVLGTPDAAPAPAPFPAHAAVWPLGRYPAPQVDPSAPPDAPPATF